MIAIRNVLILPLLAAALAMTGCDEIVTGEKADAIAVSENDASGYGTKPVEVKLSGTRVEVRRNVQDSKVSH
jgi:hypothetical protein